MPRLLRLTLQYSSLWKTVHLHRMSYSTLKCQSIRHFQVVFQPDTMMLQQFLMAKSSIHYNQLRPVLKSILPGCVFLHQPTELKINCPCRCSFSTVIENTTLNKQKVRVSLTNVQQPIKFHSAEPLESTWYKYLLMVDYKST